jgi:putative transposase
MSETIATFTLLDIFIIDEQNQRPIGRPWLTVILDFYSGMPLGFSLGFEPPSHLTVTDTLRKIKSEEWVSDRLPNKLYIDRGKEFSSKQFMEECSLLDIDVHYGCCKKLAEEERFFKLLDEHLITKFGFTKKKLLCFFNAKLGRLFK